MTQCFQKECKLWDTHEECIITGEAVKNDIKLAHHGTDWWLIFLYCSLKTKLGYYESK